MKSIRTKISLLVILCTILVAAIVGTISIQNAMKLIEENSTDIINEVCKNSKQEIDSAILRIEQSVKTLAACIVNELDDVKQFQSSTEYINNLTDNMENIIMNATENTEGAVSAYLRFNPDFTEPTSGLFFTRDSANGVLKKLTPTDFSIYDKTDDAHVGWYYIPINNHQPLWMSPYSNENLQIYMISYVIPLYKDNIPIGVIGMDIDFTLIQDFVDKIGIYDTGYAFLVDQDNRIMYHKTLELNEKTEDINTDGKSSELYTALEKDSTENTLIPYKYDGVIKKMVHMTLANNMKLILTAPVSEINASANKLIIKIVTSTVIAVILSLMFALFIIQSVVKPIKELNLVAKKIADGDLNVTILCKSKDEIGTLSKSFNKTVVRLREYINYIREISDVLDKIANGNLVFDLEYEYVGEFIKIKESFQNISKSLNSIFKKMHFASQQVTVGSEQVATDAQALSQGTSQQAGSVQELSATVHEISAQVNINAKNAQEAYLLAQEAGYSIGESTQRMKEMTEAMNNITKVSDKISQIVKTIENIAAQTNILALNAAIESARAGEAGKSFAVVANEVGSLSLEVEKATKNISQLVQNSITAIANGNVIVNKTEISLENVTQKSRVIENKIQEIASASQEQANSLVQINLEIEQISTVVQTNSTTAEEDAQVSENMANQAQILKDLIDHFKLL